MQPLHLAEKMSGMWNFISPPPSFPAFSFLTLLLGEEMVQGLGFLLGSFLGGVWFYRVWVASWDVWISQICK